MVDKLPKGICKDCLTNVNFAFNFRNVIINNDIDLQERLKYLVDRVENTAVFLKCENNAFAIDETTLEPDTVLNEDSNHFSNDQRSTDTSPADTVFINIPKNDKMLATNVRSLTSKPKLKHCQDRTYRCVCGFQTTDYQLHRRHHYAHRTNTAKNYECKQCDFKSRIRSEYRKHVKTVHIRMIVCNVCGKSFRHTNLGKHMQTHTESTVACDQCGKVFKNKESMRAHVMLHRGKVFKCEICGVVKKYGIDFARHKRTHLREYRCFCCNY